MNNLIVITLKQKGKYWYLISPIGISLTQPFRGDKDRAIEWANAWISSWHNWTLKVEEEQNEAK